MELKTIEGLRTVLIAGWEMLKRSTVDKLCASFPSRLEMWLDNRGHSISRDLFRVSEIRLHVDGPNRGQPTKTRHCRDCRKNFARNGGDVASSRGSERVCHQGSVLWVSGPSKTREMACSGKPIGGVRRKAQGGAPERDRIASTERAPMIISVT
jgi:hypothetical protein